MRITNNKTKTRYIFRINDGDRMTKTQVLKYLSHKESLKGNEEYTITVYKEDGE